MSDKPHVVSEVCYRELAEKCDRLHDENERLKEQIRHYQQTLANLKKDREANTEPRSERGNGRPPAHRDL